jgi:DNA mismatch endonuclease (patch repair protein)
MDRVSRKVRSRMMSKVKSRNSKIELGLRKVLWRKGLRYRTNVSKLVGKPDLANVKRGFVIFVDSCFWHGCPKHFSIPVSRRKFWRKKLERNKSRDIEVSNYYHSQGWRIFRIWEHQIDKDVDSVCDWILSALRTQTRSH